MIPASFDYEVAESVDHAIALLGEREDAKLLAGGHSLLPAMKLRLARPALVVDVGRLAGIADDGGALGHRQRQRAIEQRADALPSIHLIVPCAATPARRSNAS